MVTPKNIVQGQLPSVFHRKNTPPWVQRKSSHNWPAANSRKGVVHGLEGKPGSEDDCTEISDEQGQVFEPGSSSFRLRQITKLTPMQGNRSLGQGREGLGSPPCWLLRIAQSSSKWATGEPENHNFKTDFICKNQIYFGSSPERENRQLIPFLLPPHDKMNSYSIRPIGARFNYRKAFEDLKYCTMCKCGEAILRLIKHVKTFFKYPFVFIWPNQHLRIINVSLLPPKYQEILGAKSCLQGTLGRESCFYLRRSLSICLI